MDEVKSRRIYIGNISPKLAENEALLQSRIAKFGNITKPLLFHTKPVNDYYFAFVEIDLSEKQFERLRTSLNGVLFMGRKLTVALAKPDFQKAWEKDTRRPGPSKREVQILQGIAMARSLRVAESETVVPSNAILGIPIGKTSVIGANNSSMGYFKSAHTHGNASANTKNKSPTHDLIGYKSYGSSIKPRSQNTQQYSRTSGGGEIVKGRLRKTTRPEAYFVRKQQTLRILINGELKQIKCYKTKLWGVEKNKTVRDLTYRFHNNAWRSGDDHIVERVVKTVPQKPCGVDGTEAQSYGNQLLHEEESDAGSDFGEEKAKSTSVLAKLFTNYDFDKPMELEDESDEDNVTYDSKGRKTVQRFDYEAEGAVEFDGAKTENVDVSEAKALMEDFKASHQHVQEVHYDEDDEGNELDFDALGQQYATEAIKIKYDREHNAVNIQDADKGDESMNVDEVEEEDNNPVEEEDLKPAFLQSNTETLRSLFNLEKSQNGFSLALDEDDIDEDAHELAEAERLKLLEQIKSKQKDEVDEIVTTTKSNRFGLFWTHFDSPFLQTQTQLSKIGHVGENVKLPGEEEGEPQLRDDGHGEEDAYERWFWSVRGEVGRECKRRKRDVARMFKKKSTRPSI